MREVTRNILNDKARVDKNSVPAGQDIGQFLIEEYGEIVSRLVGESGDIDITFTRNGTAKFTLRAADAISIPLAKTPKEFMLDLETIVSVSETVAPAVELEFIEQMRKLGKSDENYDQLQAQLAKAFDYNSGIPLTLAYPHDADADTIEAQSYKVKVPGFPTELTPDLTLERIRKPIASLPESRRLKLLSSATIQAFLDETGDDPCSSQISAAKWIASDISVGSRQYFFHAGSFFEVGTDYAKYLNDRAKFILSLPSSLTLPAWIAKYKDEDDYNKYVSDNFAGYTCLDKKRITTRLHRHGIEPCDLVGPQGQLIHVKKTEESGPLSHLFNQGLVSTESLHYSAEAREKFIEKVAKYGGGRKLPDNWRPSEVIFAIASNVDRTDPSKLFTFSKVALARCFERLSEVFRVKVSVVSIERPSA